MTVTDRPLRLAVVIAALGVVFGDIGTSPIYTLATVFNPSDPHPVPMSDPNIYGVVSLIFWSVMLIVTLTYVTLVMRADNNGEGGIMALITLLRRSGGDQSSRRTARVLAALGIFGAALFFGDSMITPAISVLSAVEGIKVIDPGFHDWVVPVTAVIIVALFSVQRHGTAVVGRFFPVQRRADRGPGTDDGAVAQKTVHRDFAYHRRCRRLLRLAVGQNSDHRFADRAVIPIRASAV